MTCRVGGWTAGFSVLCHVIIVSICAMNELLLVPIKVRSNRVSISIKSSMGFPMLIQTNHTERQH